MYISIRSDLHLALPNYRRKVPQEGPFYKIWLEHRCAVTIAL